MLKYPSFLNTDLQNAFCNLSEKLKQEINFQQDGASVNCLEIVGSTFLSKVDKPLISWSLRSLNIALLDGYLSATIKNKVYKSRFYNIEKLINQTKYACQQISKA